MDFTDDQSVTRAPIQRVKYRNHNNTHQAVAIMPETWPMMHHQQFWVNRHFRGGIKNNEYLSPEIIEQIVSSKDSLKAAIKRRTQSKAIENTPNIKMTHDCKSSSFAEKNM